MDGWRLWLLVKIVEISVLEMRTVKSENFLSALGGPWLSTHYEHYELFYELLTSEFSFEEKSNFLMKVTKCKWN